MTRGKHPESAYIRFWKFVNKQGPIHPIHGQCWQWKGRPGNHGYGQIMALKKIQLAHRLSFILHYGEIPYGLFVLHQCDNRMCVNPDHLFLGDSLANMTDMDEKGRRALEFMLPHTKLSDEQVVEIRQRYKHGNGEILAKEYNVKSNTITRIANGVRRSRV